MAKCTELSEADLTTVAGGEDQGSLRRVSGDDGLDWRPIVIAEMND
jgi:hypothetical protein